MSVSLCKGIIKMMLQLNVVLPFTFKLNGTVPVTVILFVALGEVVRKFANEAACNRMLDGVVTLR